MPSSTNDTRSLSRRLNEQAVLDVIYKTGPTSRTDVAQATGLSKPTVSSIVEDLVVSGLVQPQGQTQGNVGRTATLYEVNPDAGHVVGVDLGGTKVRAALCDVFGTILAERVVPTDISGPDAVIEQILGLADDLTGDAGIDPESGRVLSVGTPGTIDPDTGQISLAYNIPSFVGVDLRERFAERNSFRVVLDNDVNMAAIGERWQGLARECENFAFLAVGTGIGMGLMLDGEIWQGRGGAAGEIGYLPLGADPFDETVRERGALEEAASGRGIVARYRSELRARDEEDPADLTAHTVFAAAEEGDPLAASVIDAEARLLATAIIAINALVAPELIVLGGGIGATPLLLDPVRRYVAELVPTENLRVETSALGHRASLFGAVAIGLQEARTIIFPTPPEPFAADGGERRVP